MSSRHCLGSFGQQLTIDNVQFDDAGMYQCEGVNNLTVSPVTRSMRLFVQCKYEIQCPGLGIDGHWRKICLEFWRTKALA